mgnify:FL=1
MLNALKNWIGFGRKKSECISSDEILRITNSLNDFYLSIYERKKLKYYGLCGFEIERIVKCDCVIAGVYGFSGHYRVKLLMLPAPEGFTFVGRVNEGAELPRRVSIERIDNRA